MTTQTGVASHGERRAWPPGAVLKNLFALVLVVGGWLALDTGYFSPDRPTRAQWEVLERAKAAPGGQRVYQSNFATEAPGAGTSPIGRWGYYNGATVSTVQYDPGGFTVSYNGVPWIGARFEFIAFQPKAIYRITIDRQVTGEPAALIVRNRQMDLVREQIPVGEGPVSINFVAPGGSRDVVHLAFIPDNRGTPQGRLRVTSVKIERLGE